ncbi:hypothetical protein KXD40_008984 [Peronospora effusa]|uniref:Uncharacterized protein n=1 Tax=Peronospora effusa TaxID=542832 RepID=A0A3R8CR64_9STRA|nr:hypothetical protein DD237_006295 [Peronospora effusa]UIZ25191.1 hypothetical protein KXD40_008984 [Peronospora effusa]
MPQCFNCGVTNDTHSPTENNAKPVEVLVSKRVRRLPTVAPNKGTTRSSTSVSPRSTLQRM